MIEDELNARPLGYNEVGRKFIVHPEFKTLVSVNNSIVIGPRGSGKTTMLKVLTPEAMDSWKPDNEVEKAIKRRVSFFGLYIPLSRIFQDDLEVRYKNSPLNDEQKNNVLLKIYYLNILESVLELVYYLLKKENASKNRELEAAKTLARILKIDAPFCYKINSLMTINSELKLEARRQLSSSEYKEKINYSGEILTSLDPVLRVVNEIFDLRPDQKYALCLDELDIYASSFTAEMIKNLRGTSTNIILKLTLAPIHDVRINEFMDPPQRIHDYDRIHLWPTSSESRANDKYLEFSEGLANQTIKDKIGKEVDLNDVLGNFSYMEVFRYLKKTETDNDFFNKINLNTDKGLENSVFEELANRQPEFNSFLKREHGIDVNNLAEVSRKVSSSVIRKLKEIVFNRVITTQVKNGKVVLRNSLPVQYHGKSMLLKALDGNPRYLKKLTSYLAECVTFKNDRVLKIPIAEQAKCLGKVKDLMMQRIYAIPTENFDRRLSPALLINQIGEYLCDKQNKDISWETTSFPSYVKVPNIREIRSFEPVFRKAINNGALMIMGDIDLAKMNTVRLKELRLNYLLNMEFKIPIRKYYPVSFERIIKIVPASNSLFNEL